MDLLWTCCGPAVDLLCAPQCVYNSDCTALVAADVTLPKWSVGLGLFQGPAANLVGGFGREQEWRDITWCAVQRRYKRVRGCKLFWDTQRLLLNGNDTVLYRKDLNGKAIYYI